MRRKRENEGKGTAFLTLLPPDPQHNYPRERTHGLVTAAFVHLNANNKILNEPKTALR